MSTTPSNTLSNEYPFAIFEPAMNDMDKIMDTKDKPELEQVLLEANLLIQRQISNIKRDLDSFTVFIDELRKDSYVARPENERNSVQ